MEKSPSGRKWHPTPISLLRKPHGSEEPGGLQSTQSQRVRHDLGTKQQWKQENQIKKITPAWLLALLKKRRILWGFPGGQWYRIHLPMQRTDSAPDPGRSRVRGATKPAHHSYWARTLEPRGRSRWSPGIRAPCSTWEGPPQRAAHALQGRAASICRS